MSDGIKIATVAPEVDPDTGILEPGVPVEEIHGRMMDFLCHVLEARFWSYAMHEWSWPQAFAGVLADDEREAESVLLRCRLHWEACLLAEACGHVRPGLAELRKQIYWQALFPKDGPCPLLSSTSIRISHLMNYHLTP